MKHGFRKEPLLAVEYKGAFLKNIIFGIKYYLLDTRLKFPYRFI